MTDRELLEKIDKKLDFICSYIMKVDNPEYRQKDYNTQFLLNVAADMYVELLEKLRNRDKNTDEKV